VHNTRKTAFHNVLLGGQKLKTGARLRFVADCVTFPYDYFFIEAMKHLAGEVVKVFALTLTLARWSDGLAGNFGKE
jgi:hypothetical protein